MNAAFRRLEVLHWHLDDEPRGWQQHDDAWPLGRQPCRAAPSPPPPGAPVVVVGGMVMDLQARPSGPTDVQRGGSVPGRVTQSAGGVARNMAEALALLLKSAGSGAGSGGGSGAGTPAAAPPPLPLLVSAVGDDLAGTALLQHWRSLGLSTGLISRLPGAATPTVSVVFDLGGEVAACVADVASLEARLAPPLLRAPAVAAALAAAPVVMLDGNLSAAALEEVCGQAAAAGVPVWFEPVSVPKSTRAASLLSLLTFVSPNERELAAMAAAVRRQQQAQRGTQAPSSRGSPQQEAGGAGPTAAAAASPRASLLRLLPDIATLLLAGVRHVVVTMGPQGAALCTLGPDRQAVAVCHVPALPAAVVNCSGAGDCLVAGCLFALARGLPAEAALAHGAAAAKAAVESQANVPPGLSAAATPTPHTMRASAWLLLAVVLVAAQATAGRELLDDEVTAAIRNMNPKTRNAPKGNRAHGTQGQSPLHAAAWVGVNNIGRCNRLKPNIMQSVSHFRLWIDLGLYLLKNPTKFSGDYPFWAFVKSQFEVWE
ncbi:hypothetical protein CHLNCDRAFT_144692 [Chlorella variabilis]|uniref:Carbohydrate kinase PfkB domain-containing protein n=1 Tax=Chlorella variabilis TaxID=554065 RepID=E1ZCT6_CHLVA|nr:hypothetical protein CHLNCDRAFT_144692 [Chlorella variabilis]EFN56299.1 hypothetical protein CHLNCDRAFT_144692 [Chlorella variabilis]|eukprot:XP_005848401.1 hypothetical protein CHLNCDRAFT_144692 [Chlorella variabilis]